ncbi:hypothetical protein SYNPS1DRAFT_26669 [Syncephalis pseudoplumigaleata]|uniref:YncI copper-binding domain-containing protein n=1 Tax=Syncephalis pseudoplumigaleata TaxID=1712513 RepID=A0A4P9Z7K0_9FUNG|nr:hypothetical protein SYNPS1DRAFT_26669 [Syncephalis pseudoplumigaleata]|eukprot:RKP27690.1 hypothetical protein SYNPS1DRAFT_26669 [Syncephalis pseudoplumigaleata]
MMFKSILSVAAMAAVLVEAHVSITPPKINADTYSSIAFRIPHGCNGSPTTKVTVKLPTNTSSVKGAFIPGWQISTTTRPLEVPFKSDGKEVNTTVDTVTWSADTAGNNSLPDTAYMDFGLTLKTPIKPNANDKLAFDLYQVCTNGSNNWTDTAPNGEHPQPAVTLLPKGASTTATSGSFKTSASAMTLAMTMLLASAGYFL